MVCSALLTLIGGSYVNDFNRFNLYRCAEIMGSVAPDYSSGQALTAIEEGAKKVLPSTMSYFGYPRLPAEARRRCGHRSFHPLHHLRLPHPRGSVRKLIPPVQRPPHHPARRVMGAAVIVGMLVGTLRGVFLTPVLHVMTTRWVNLKTTVT